MEFDKCGIKEKREDDNARKDRRSHITFHNAGSQLSNSGVFVKFSKSLEFYTRPVNRALAAKFGKLPKYQNPSWRKDYKPTKLLHLNFLSNQHLFLLAINQINGLCEDWQTLINGNKQGKGGQRHL